MVRLACISRCCLQASLRSPSLDACEQIPIKHWDLVHFFDRRPAWCPPLAPCSFPHRRNLQESTGALLFWASLRRPLRGGEACPCAFQRSHVAFLAMTLASIYDQNPSCRE